VIGTHELNVLRFTRVGNEVLSYHQRDHFTVCKHGLSTGLTFEQFDPLVVDAFIKMMQEK